MQDLDSKSSAIFSSESWKSGLLELQNKLDPHIYTAFIEPLRPTAFHTDDNSEVSEIILTAPSKLVCNHVDRNFKEQMEAIFSSQLGLDRVKVRLAVQDSEQALVSKQTSPYVVVKKVRGLNSRNQDLKAEHEREGYNNINPRYTFSNFVVGNNNQFCHAAAMHVAEDPGNGYNPMFIYGGVGLGKTHLLHAIGNAALKENPSLKVLYMSSETFTNELIQALRFAKMDEFKSKLRSINLLLIDDIQFMCGKERTQEEFFHTFNALYNEKRQIVLTSDKTPQDIPGIEDRLRTRFSWGLTADLQAPDFETRVAILKRKAAIESFGIPEAVCHFIAERISSNVRELEGALTKLHALASLQKVTITPELAESALKPFFGGKKVNLTVDDIKKAVSNHFKVKVSEIVSKRRTRNLAFPRHIAMYLCRKHTTCSYPEIGGYFGGRDHSSVIHAANVVSSKLNSDPDVQDHIRTIERALLSR